MKKFDDLKHAPKNYTWEAWFRKCVHQMKMELFVLEKLGHIETLIEEVIAKNRKGLWASVFTLDVGTRLPDRYAEPL